MLSLGSTAGDRGVIGDEDCLFLNIYAPSNTSSASLPVLFYIHGGGYGAGNGQQDLSTIITANNNSFVAVSIQYRVRMKKKFAMELRQSDNIQS